MPRTLPTQSVPCRGCRLCCQGDAVRLEGEDLTRGYESEPHPYIPGALMIAHTPNGDCVYLGDNGCTIHGRAPALCRVADCRSLALRYDLQAAQTLHMMGRLNFDVWDRGNQLLAEMKAQMEAQKNAQTQAQMKAQMSARTKAGSGRTAGISHKGRKR